MYIGDFVKEVKELSSKYDVEVTDGQVNVYYSRRNHVKYPKSPQVLTVLLQTQYTFMLEISLDSFEALPFSHKLYMLGAELAMTPLNERTPESYKRSQQTKVANRAIQEANRAIQEANCARREVRAFWHNPSKPSQANSFRLKEPSDYTGINDATGEPIYVGDIVERVLDMRDAYSSTDGFDFKERDKQKFPDFDAMSEPFEVKRDCCLYGHWIAKSVAEGDNFGVDTLCSSKELLKVNGPTNPS